MQEARTHVLCALQGTHVLTATRRSASDVDRELTRRPVQLSAPIVNPAWNVPPPVQWAPRVLPATTVWEMRLHAECVQLVTHVLIQRLIQCRVLLECTRISLGRHRVSRVTLVTRVRRVLRVQIHRTTSVHSVTTAQMARHKYPARRANTVES